MGGADLAFNDVAIQAAQGYQFQGFLCAQAGAGKHAELLQALAGDIAQRRADAILQAAEPLAIPLQRAADTGDDRVLDLPESIFAVYRFSMFGIASGKLPPGIAVSLPDGGKNAIALTAL